MLHLKQVAFRLHSVLHARILALDPGFHERGVSEDETRRGADEPEKGHDGGGEVEEGKTDNEEGGVERFLGDDGITELNGFRNCVKGVG